MLVYKNDFSGEPTNQRLYGDYYLDGDWVVTSGEYHSPQFDGSSVILPTIPKLANIEITVRLRSGSGSSWIFPIFRWTGSQGLVFIYDGTTMYLFSYVGGLHPIAQTTTNYPVLQNSANAEIYVKVRSVGNSHQIKFWEVGDTEPASWDYSVTNSNSPLAGWVGFYQFLNNAFCQEIVVDDTTTNVGYGIDDHPVTLSPYTWREVSSNRLESANAGSYFKANFTGTSFRVVVDLGVLRDTSTTIWPILAVKVDGAANWTYIQVTQSVTTLASGLTSGNHTIVCAIKAVVESVERWVVPTMAVRILAWGVDSGATITPTTPLENNIIFYGDSITEGVFTDSISSLIAGNNSTKAWSYKVGELCNAEFGIIGFGAQAWNAGGNGGVPSFLNAWDFYSSGNSRLTSAHLSPVPDMVIINHGTNPSSNTRSTVSSMLTELRNATSTNTHLVVIIPFNQAQASDIALGISDSGQTVTTVNLGTSGVTWSTSTPTYSYDGLHPNTSGNALLAPAVFSALPALGSDSMVGSITEITSAYGYPTGLGNLSGSSIELTSAYSYLTGLGNLSGSSIELTSAYGYLSENIIFQGISNVIVSAYGNSTGIGNLSGISIELTSAYSHPTGLGNLSGSSTELTSAYGYPTGLGNLSGISIELTSAYGYLSELSILEGSSNVIVSAHGNPTGLGNLSGSSTELTSAYGYLSNGSPLGNIAYLGVSATYGNYAGGVVDRKMCTLTNVVATKSGQTIGMYFYVHAGNSSTNRGKLAVYDENGNIRSGYGGEFVDVTPGTWAFVPFTQPIVSGSTYRPCYISNGSVGTTYENTGEQLQGYSPVGYANEPSANTSNLAWQDYTVSMYIKYEYASEMTGSATVITSAYGRLDNGNISGNLRIYCIGSSTTAGLPNPNTGGYRSLVQDLLRSKYEFDFVGSQASGPVGYDNNHSGIGGMTISGCNALIQNELAFYMSNLNDQKGYVVLQIGDADVYFDSNLSNYPTYASIYTQILDYVHNFNPNIRVICVNSKPIVGDVSGTYRADYLNQLTIPDIIERSSFCLYCDIYNPILDTPNWETTLYAEQTHLSTSGYQLIANILYEIFDSIFAETFINITADSALTGKGSVSGATFEITSAYSYPTGLGNLSGSSIELTSAYGNFTGLLSLSATSIEITSAYGIPTGLGNLSGSILELTSAHGTSTGIGNLSGISIELTSAYSYPTGLGNLSGSSIQITSAYSYPTGLGNLSGSTNVILQIEGILDVVDSSIFYSYITSTLSGNITGLGNLSGSTSETTSAYGYPTGLGNLSGSSIELTSAYGFPSGLIDLSGISNVVVDMNGTLSSNITYYANISISTSGILNGTLNLNGQLDNTISTSGILNGILNFSGATNVIVSAFSQDGLLVTILSGDSLNITTSNRFQVRTTLFDNYTSNYNGMANNTNMPNGFITKCNPIYNNERSVYSSMLTEAYNQHGVCMTYYITTWDVNYDRIFGEDTNRRFERLFNMMGYFQLPREEKLWSKFGIEGLDEFSVFVSKKHFRDASTFGNNQVVGNIGQNTYSEYIPKIGDIIQSQYNKYLYEITEVKEESGMFLLSKQHSWEFIVRPYKDEHINLSSATSASMGDIVDYTNKTDIFDITSAVNEKVRDIKYTPKSTEKSNGDPFAGW